MTGLAPSLPGVAVESFDDPLAAMALCRRTAFDLLIADYQMADLTLRSSAATSSSWASASV